MIVPYTVKEIFYTLQGEGSQAGRPAIFCRFTGCNLWSGREEDRSKAICQFCDTDFVGTDGTEGGRYSTPASLARTIESLWPLEDKLHRFVVFTGGEPLLQLDTDLIVAMHALHFEIAIETNGTLEAPEGIDWICVSPKAGAPLKLTRGHELKIVVPQEGLNPLDYVKLDFQRFSIQPMDGPHRIQNTEFAIDFCLKNPLWQLSLQTHKTLGIR